jgi:hypothetical protein
MLRASGRTSKARLKEAGNDLTAPRTHEDIISHHQNHLRISSFLEEVR